MRGAPGGGERRIEPRPSPHPDHPRGVDPGHVCVAAHSAFGPDRPFAAGEPRAAAVRASFSRAGIAWPAIRRSRERRAAPAQSIRQLVRPMHRGGARPRGIETPGREDRRHRNPRHPRSGRRIP